MTNNNTTAKPYPNEFTVGFNRNSLSNFNSSKNEQDAVIGRDQIFFEKIFFRGIAWDSRGGLTKVRELISFFYCMHVYLQLQYIFVE